MLQFPFSFLLLRSKKSQRELHAFREHAMRKTWKGCKDSKIFTMSFIYKETFITQLLTTGFTGI